MDNGILCWTGVRVTCGVPYKAAHYDDDDDDDDNDDDDGNGNGNDGDGNYDDGDDPRVRERNRRTSGRVRRRQLGQRRRMFKQLHQRDDLL